jgi:hypothetical protein
MTLTPVFTSLKIQPVGLFFPVFILIFLLGNDGLGQVAQQPVSFSHKTHAQDFAIACRFCHYYANRSTMAGIPSLSDCLSCHQLVKGSDETQQAEIAKLDHFWLLKQALAWNKVNDLPDFVFFSHQSHTQLGFACERCHGEVASLDATIVAGKIDNLTMGWCLACHVEKHQLDKNGRVSLPVANNENQTPPAELTIRQGSTECQSCHQ